MQQTHDSNWVPFFAKTFTEAELLAKELLKSEEYENYYIGEIITFSQNFHSKHLKRKIKNE